jgi:hypothetical protein
MLEQVRQMSLRVFVIAFALLTTSVVFGIFVVRDAISTHSQQFGHESPAQRTLSLVFEMVAVVSMIVSTIAIRRVAR